MFHPPTGLSDNVQHFLSLAEAQTIVADLNKILHNTAFNPRVSNPCFLLAVLISFGSSGIFTSSMTSGITLGQLAEHCWTNHIVQQVMRRLRTTWEAMRSPRTTIVPRLGSALVASFSAWCFPTSASLSSLPSQNPVARDNWRTMLQNGTGDVSVSFYFELKNLSAVLVATVWLFPSGVVAPHQGYDQALTNLTCQTNWSCP